MVIDGRYCGGAGAGSLGSGFLQWKGRERMMAVQTDGRDIDTLYAELSGEASIQRTSGKGNRDEIQKAQTWTQLPQPQPHDPTYYDRPVLQASVWTWAIPTYYWVGGLAGASAVLAAALQLRNRERHRTVVRRCHLIAIGGAIVSGGLLIYDLGRPMRFLNMLRVFR